MAVGDADVVLAGGVESMSRAPWVLPKPAKGYPTGHEQLWSTTLGWRMTNPRMPSEWTVSLGEGAELLADKYGDQPGAAGRVRARLPPQGDGRMGRGLVRSPRWWRWKGSELDRDESIRADTTLEKLATLRPVFRSAGTVTAGNASPMNDGSAALVLGLGGRRGPGRRDAAGPGACRGPRAASSPTCTASGRWRRGGPRWSGPG